MKRQQHALLPRVKVVATLAAAICFAACKSDVPTTASSPAANPPPIKVASGGVIPQPTSWSFPDVVESARKVATRNVEGREFNEFGLAYSTEELDAVPMATMSPEELQKYADIVTHAYPDAVFREIGNECEQTPVEQLNSTAVAGIAYVSLHAIESGTRAGAAQCLSSIQEKLRTRK